MVFAGRKKRPGTVIGVLPGGPGLVIGVAAG